MHCKTTSKCKLRRINYTPLTQGTLEMALDRASDISRGCRLAAKFRKIREIHKNTKNTVKFGRNLIKYMSVQHI